MLAATSVPVASITIYSNGAPGQPERRSDWLLPPQLASVLRAGRNPGGGLGDTGRCLSRVTSTECATRPPCTSLRALLRATAAPALPHGGGGLSIGLCWRKGAADQPQRPA